MLMSSPIQLAFTQSWHWSHSTHIFHVRKSCSSYHESRHHIHTICSWLIDVPAFAIVIPLVLKGVSLWNLFSYWYPEFQWSSSLSSRYIIFLAFFSLPANFLTSFNSFRIISWMHSVDASLFDSVSSIISLSLVSCSTIEKVSVSLTTDEVYYLKQLCPPKCWCLPLEIGWSLDVIPHQPSETTSYMPKNMEIPKLCRILPSVCSHISH